MWEKMKRKKKESLTTVTNFKPVKTHFLHLSPSMRMVPLPLTSQQQGPGLPDFLQKCCFSRKILLFKWQKNGVFIIAQVPQRLFFTSKGQRHVHCPYEKGEDCSIYLMVAWRLIKRLQLLQRTPFPVTALVFCPFMPSQSLQPGYITSSAFYYSHQTNLLQYKETSFLITIVQCWCLSRVTS